MSDPETVKKPSMLLEAFALVDDHLELAALEAQYEWSQGARQLRWFAAAVIFGVATLLWLQVALFCALMRAGLPAWGASLILLAVNGAAAAAAGRAAARRDALAGTPFSGTRTQWGQTKQWIRTLLS